MDGWRPDPRDVAGLLLAAGLLLPPLARAAPPAAAQMQALERGQAASLLAVHEAEARQDAAEAEARTLANARVASLAALRTLEQATGNAAATVAALAGRRREAEARLQARAAQMAPLLPLMERLSLYPAETLLALPAGREDSLTGLLVLKGVARQIEADAEALRAEQAEVAALSARMGRQEAQLASAQSAQAVQAASLDKQIADAQARGQAAEDDAADATRHGAEQAAQAHTLRGALAQLEAARHEAETKARFAAAAAERARRQGDAAEARHQQVALSQPAGPGLAGAAGAPVIGAVARAFGEPGDGGPSSGVSYTAAPGAHVSAPCGGRVVFAGPFRSYGQLMIIDCGGGYHFVLAGMDRLDVRVGRPVQPGEPVGIMPAWDPHSSASRPTLYVELRDHGQAINPAPYLRARS